ncbi:transketolase C-terminal domain-containing protein [Brachyspira sp.]|uniref:transketolase family protein n=1 Tax=Brachyspira sp. TaxID=1977261 RepID=UPI00260F3549|nr:transketolase C-terminal domain-containing protein [Brachyspira sp.]
MRKTFINTLIECAKKDDSIFVLVGDLGFSVFEEFSSLFPDRYINVGVAEQNMAGIAAGLAYEGYKVLTYSIGNFNTLRCFEQIRNDICYQNLNVKIVSVGAGFSYGTLGYTHFAIEDIATMRLLPNMKVYSPSTINEVELVTKQIFLENSPCYFRIGSSAINWNYEIKKDKINIIKEGKDILVLVTGNILSNVIEASKLLEEKGISICIASVYSLSPFDSDFLKEKIKYIKKIVTIEEHGIGGLYSIVAEILINDNIKLKGLYTFKDACQYADSQNYMRERYNLNTNNIKNIILDFIK